MTSERSCYVYIVLPGRTEFITAARFSYLVLADELRKTSMDAKKDLRELFSRMCFNALISNLDDHPRNHAILARNKGWQLSPAYDLTPTPTIAQEARSLAMVCGEQGRLSRRENLISGHARFFLTKEEAEAIIDTMAETVKKNWYPCLRHVGVNEKDCETIASAFVYEGFFYTSLA